MIFMCDINRFPISHLVKSQSKYLVISILNLNRHNFEFFEHIAHILQTDM